MKAISVGGAGGLFMFHSVKRTMMQIKDLKMILKMRSLMEEI